MMSKHYSKEFRLQTARLVVEQGCSYAEVAQRLGPSAPQYSCPSAPKRRYLAHRVGRKIERHTKKLSPCKGGVRRSREGV
jgi:transposase